MDLKGWIREKENEGGELTDPINLRRLQCFDITLDRILQSLLPDGLQILDFYIFNHKLFLKPANLLLSLSTLTSFAKLPRLRLHSFRFNTVSRSTTLPLELLSHLPPTVARLEFLEYIPFRTFLAFLHNPSPSSVRILNIDVNIDESATSSSKITKEMTPLLSVRGEKDIRIEYISPDQDLFRMSPSLLFSVSLTLIALFK